jgi:hypothetical protein
MTHDGVTAHDHWARQRGWHDRKRSQDYEVATSSYSVAVESAMSSSSWLSSFSV